MYFGNGIQNDNFQFIVTKLPNSCEKKVLGIINNELKFEPCMKSMCNKKSRDYKRLLFLSKPFMMNMRNQGSKENLGAKFKEGIRVKLCLKL